MDAENGEIRKLSKEEVEDDTERPVEVMPDGLDLPGGIGEFSSNCRSGETRKFFDNVFFSCCGEQHGD
jgi:hypothetical protein